MANPFVYVQLQTPNIEASREFYSALFDWQFEDTSTAQLSYLEVRVGDGTAGGMLLVPDREGQAKWVPYILVNDVVDVTRAVESLGGIVRVPPTEIAGQRWFAVIQDPSGAVFAITQVIHPEPGTSGPRQS